MDPVHGDVGIAKMGEFWSHAGGPVCRDGHDDVGGSRSIDQLIELLDAAQNAEAIAVAALNLAIG